jgi:hypothetical protein
MAKIPLPQRGQPIDLAYLYDIANAVNNLSAQVSPSSYKYVTVSTPTSGPQSVKASEAKIIGGYVEVANNSTVTSSNDKEFSFEITGGQFKYAPIVTATPVMIGTTDSGKSATVILKNVTTSRIDGVVRFNASGDVKVGVNLIIIGIPN